MISTILSVLAKIAAAIAVLRAGGVNLGPIGNEALAVITATETDMMNFADGQAVIIGHFTENGTKGTLVAVKDGGPAYTSIFGV